jgi:hypothetical protein
MLADYLVASNKGDLSGGDAAVAEYNASQLPPSFRQQLPQVYTHGIWETSLVDTCRAEF